jgi:hypothetical protein
MLLLGGATGACFSDEPASSPTDDEGDLIDGRICGFFTPELVHSIVGHDEVSTRHEGIGSAEDRAERAQECSVVDDRRNQPVILVQVNDYPRNLPDDRRGPPPEDCRRPRALADWYGTVCWGTDTVRALAWPGDDRFIELTYFPDGRADRPEDRDEYIATTSTLVEDVQSNVEEYDLTHR